MKPHCSSNYAARAAPPSSPPTTPPKQHVNIITPELRVAPTSRSHPHNLDLAVSFKHSQTDTVLQPPRPRRLDAEELFQPLSIASNDLPEWIQGYLSLLAESSTCNGSIQRMLVHIMARGAADTAKLAHMISDPVDGVADVLADQGTQLLLKQVARVQGSAVGRVSEEGTGLTALAQKVGPMQGKMLSILLSLMMSGLASSMAADAVQISGAMSHHGDSAPMVKPDVVRNAAAAAGAVTAVGVADEASDFFRFDSIRAKVGPSFMARAAPSLTSGASGAGASLIGAGGMATSTALKMLRADSKLRSPDLGNVIGAILDTVSESTNSMDWDERKHQPLGMGMATLDHHMGGTHNVPLGQSMVAHSRRHMAQGPGV